MDEDIKTWLYDIVQSIDEIESYFSDVEKTLENYLSDTRTKRAVERNLEIIGEATKRIKNKNVSFQLQNSRQIIGARNRISHGYDVVSDELIWSIVMNHLPNLKIEIEQKLKK